MTAVPDVLSCLEFNIWSTDWLFSQYKSSSRAQLVGKKFRYCKRHYMVGIIVFIWFICCHYHTHQTSFSMFYYSHPLTYVVFLVWTIFKGACLTFKSIFHTALNLFMFNCEIMLKSIPGTNQY